MSPEDIARCRSLARDYIKNDSVLALDVYRRMRARDTQRYFGQGPVGPWEAVKNTDWFLLEVMTELSGESPKANWLQEKV